uniref:Uncharacterized protein n=1 Tax=virus sp. ctBM815 TaxID=2825806 RepID=A0A8S5RK88_9VIRU|nr:MAG TPA: hypothetical protein [virus sp. ctBM815]
MYRTRLIIYANLPLYYKGSSSVSIVYNRLAFTN